MATRYVRSTDGSDADNGTTWALAKATLTGVAAIDTAGDEIWVSQVHAETTAAAIAFSWAGTVVSPTHILCGDDAAAPPTALATTATVTTTGASDITIDNSGHVYCYGISFLCGSGAVTASIVLNIGNVKTEYESCSFQLVSTGASSLIDFSGGANGHAILNNCTFKFGATGQKLSNSTRGTFEINGGSILAGSSAITVLTSLVGVSKWVFSGFDLSNAGATISIAASTAAGNTVILRNCKLPASWSGSVNSSTPGLASVFELYNSDSADTNYRYQRKTQFGIIDGETTVVATGGASDGTTPISWKMATNADAEWRHQTLNSGEIVQWNETVGSALTATIEIVHDSVTNITDREIWIDVQYLGTSGFPLSLFISDVATNYLTAAADQADSSATWTTTGLTNPNTQKLNVTFTPQEKGFIHATVRMTKASYTVYVDPKITIT